ncbi:HAD-like domain-containing protein [Obelidium mucronatum]|nr:HAD-like domain-containing protein [Obelidium mucronatum]
MAEFECVLTDIEGTTTSISFVHSILFPYARDNAESFLTARWNSDELKPYIEALKKLAASDREAGGGNNDVPDLNAKDKKVAIKNTVQYIHSLIDSDRKVGALKDLQGFMWKFAYEDGSVKGHVYDDVVPSLKKFEKDGIPVYIYSSGSIAAQKLIFGYSEKGDILSSFKGHFDTTIGYKLERDSYTKIATEIGLEPKKILFLSDNVKEIEAAHKAGFLTCILFRPGNPELVPAPVKSKYTLPDGTLVPVAKTFFGIFSFTNFFKPAKLAAAATAVSPKKRKTTHDKEEKDQVEEKEEVNEEAEEEVKEKKASKTKKSKKKEADEDEDVQAVEEEEVEKAPVKAKKAKSDKKTKEQEEVEEQVEEEEEEEKPKKKKAKKEKDSKKEKESKKAKK